MLQECVKEAGIIPQIVKLTFDQAIFWTAERFEGVGSSSGAKDAVEEAKKVVESIISSAGNITTKEVEIEWNEGRITLARAAAALYAASRLNLALKTCRWRVTRI